jgi:tetratricopeptide (TPR) repeat protein
MRHAAPIVALLICCAAAAHAAVPADCWALRKHGHSAEAQTCFDGLTQSSDTYNRAEGFWGLEEWQQAGDQFELALKLTKSPAIWRVRYGMLLHERFNNTDAAKLYEEALQMNPKNAEAYVGLAVLSAEGFDDKAEDYLTKAIDLDPKLAEAHEWMADLALANDDTDMAVAEADKAIALESDALDAMSN